MMHTARRTLKGVILLALIAACVPAAFAAAPEKKDTANLRFNYGKAPGQFGELWLPNDYESHPVAVLIHGGCWSVPASLEAMNAMATTLRNNGIAVWNLEFRRIGMEGAGYPGSFMDIANGIDFLKKIKDSQQLDLSRVVIVGAASGGHLALWAAGRKQIKPDSQLYMDNPLPIKTVVTLGGFGDLAAYRNAPTGCGFKMVDYLVNVTQRSKEDYFADTSPAALLPLGVKQVMISGSKDTTVPKKQGLVYTKKAKAAGDSIEFITIEDATQGDLLNPKSKPWQHVQSFILENIR